MWKKGDRVKFIKNGDYDSVEDEGLKLGEVYKLIDRHEIESDEDGNIDEEDLTYVDDNNYKYAIELNGSRFWIELNSFELYKKKKAKNELDVLDNIRENFRFGY